MGIGLISYSAYLWHQPVFAFARIGTPDELTPLSYFALIAVAFGLASLSWKFVESPFRNRRVMPIRAMTAWLTPVAVSIAAFATLGFVYSDTLSAKRLDGTDRDILSTTKRYSNHLERYYWRDECFIGRPGDAPLDNREFAQSCAHPMGDPADIIFVWGDSHAAALSAGLSQLNSGVVQYAAAACPPNDGTFRVGRRGCEGVGKFVLTTIAKLAPRTVILQANWAAYSDVYRDGHLPVLLKEIRRMSPASHVVVMGGFPNWGSVGLPKIIVSKHLSISPLARLEPRGNGIVDRADKQLVMAANAAGVLFVDPKRYLCVESKCMIFVYQGTSYEVSAWDYGHLTVGASIYVSRNILEFLSATSRPDA